MTAITRSSQKRIARTGQRDYERQNKMGRTGTVTNRTAKTWKPGQSSQNGMARRGHYNPFLYYCGDPSLCPSIYPFIR
jgi:hypothetical protein